MDKDVCWESELGKVLHAFLDTLGDELAHSEALRSQFARAKQALKTISELNYADHSEACMAGIIARDALAELNDLPV